ncbi:hypothetical protein IJS77_04590 [bacterium]|nr:hypothetical protein [bacterium]
MRGIRAGKYDLYVSMGAVCSCTQALRYSKLQFYSYPFDWIGGPSFLERIELIHNNFKDYIIKENLEFGYKVEETKCDAYYDKKRGMQINHDFKQGRNFDEMYEEVVEKYNRRGKRLIEQIKASKKVLFVFMQTPHNDKTDLTDEVLLKGSEKFKEYFPEVQCDILYITCKHDIKPVVRNVSDNIQHITFDYDARDKISPWVVNFKTLDKLYRHFSISKRHLTKENIKEIRKYKLKLFLKGRMLQWI